MKRVAILFGSWRRKWQMGMFGTIMSDKDNEATYQNQLQTYAAFMKLAKWSVLGLAILMIALYFIIQP